VGEAFQLVFETPVSVDEEEEVEVAATELVGLDFWGLE